MFKSCTKCGGDNKYIYNAVIRYIESPYAKEEVEVTETLENVETETNETVYPSIVSGMTISFSSPR